MMFVVGLWLSDRMEFGNFVFRSRVSLSVAPLDLLVLKEVALQGPWVGCLMSQLVEPLSLSFDLGKHLRCVFLCCFIFFYVFTAYLVGIFCLVLVMCPGNRNGQPPSCVIFFF